MRRHWHKKPSALRLDRTRRARGFESATRLALNRRKPVGHPDGGQIVATDEVRKACLEIRTTYESLKNPCHCLRQVGGSCRWYWRATRLVGDGGPSAT